MKKYVKPELVFEQYELNQHIADCAWEMNDKTKEVCTASWDSDMGGNFGTLFTTALNCQHNVENGYENYCETNGSEGINTWKS